MIFLKNPSLELASEGVKVQFTVSRSDAYDIADTLSDIEIGKEYDLSIKKKNPKRSLNANNYHWVLCEQLAKKLHTSKYQVHNQLLCDYGTDWLDDEGKHIYIMMKDNDAYLRSETMHYRPTDATEDRNGTMYRWFILLLPSHLMDTAQMSALIDGTVADAKEVGIETRTPDEIERMKSLWDTTA